MYQSIETRRVPSCAARVECCMPIRWAHHQPHGSHSRILQTLQVSMAGVSCRNSHPSLVTGVHRLPSGGRPSESSFQSKVSLAEWNRPAMVAEFQLTAPRSQDRKLSQSSSEAASAIAQLLPARGMMRITTLMCSRGAPPRTRSRHGAAASVRPPIKAPLSQETSRSGIETSPDILAGCPKLSF